MYTASQPTTSIHLLSKSISVSHMYITYIIHFFSCELDEGNNEGFCIIQHTLTPHTNISGIQLSSFTQHEQEHFRSLRNQNSNICMKIYTILDTKAFTYGSDE